MTNLPTPGEYQAEITGHTLESKSGNPVLVLTFRIATKYNQQTSEFQNVSNDCEIKSWNYIVKKDNTINQSKVNQLSDAGLWNPTDGIEWLGNSDNFLGQSCRITVRNEKGTDGKERTNVSWISHFNDPVKAPGAVPATSDEVQNMASRFDRMLQAQAPLAASKDRLPF